MKKGLSHKPKLTQWRPVVKRAANLARKSAHSKGQEIIASLTKLAETLESGGPDADVKRFPSSVVSVAPDAA